MTVYREKATGKYWHITYNIVNIDTKEKSYRITSNDNVNLSKVVTQEGLNKNFIREESWNY